MTKRQHPDRIMSHHHGADLFPNFKWDAEKVAYLKKAWLAGDTALQIGASLQCSRSGVLGKINRLKLNGRARDIARTAERKANGNGGGIVVRVKAKRSHAHEKGLANHGGTRHSCEMVPSNASLAEFNAGIGKDQRKTLVELEPHHCRWPLWPDGERDGFYCGAPEADTTERRPYCREHTRVAGAGYTRERGYGFQRSVNSFR